MLFRSWNLISFDLPECVKNRVKAVPIRLLKDGKDTIMWKYSKDEEFSTKSAYQLANQGEILDTQFHGQWIWKLDILPKITNFL